MSNTDNFQEAEIQQLVTDSCNTIIKNPYTAASANNITEQLIEDVIRKLADRKKDVKYLVSATIQQNLGSGTHSAITCVWDQTQDNYVTVKWESPSCYVVVTVFGIIIDK